MNFIERIVSIIKRNKGGKIMNFKERVVNIIKEIGTTPDKLIEVLIEVQNNSNNNYISEEECNVISKEMNIPLSKVYGVASFYSMLSTKKKGKYVIQICNSAPCYLNGGKEITKIFETELGIKIGEVTNDELFSLEFTSCIGACDLAPAAKINEELYGKLNKEKITLILNKLREEEK